MTSHSAPTRTLPNKPSLAQLRKQARELLNSYRAGEAAAVAEVERFEPSPVPASFTLADAQRVLARAYGFSSWPALKNHVDGANFAALLEAAEAGDVAAVHRFTRAMILLEAGASLTIRDSLLQSTPLGWACRWGRADLVRLYLERGADAVESDAERWARPLAWATKRGHQAVIELLRSHGAR